MRRTLWLGLALVLALAAAGGAIAAKRAADAQAVTAEFSAVASSVKVWTCANAPSTQVVRGRFTGTATSADARLAGPIRLDVHSSYDGADGIGWVRGTVRFSRGDDAGWGNARLYAVNKGGHLEGVLVGRVGAPGAHLVANVSADFSETGFTNAKLGSGSGENTAVAYGGACKKKSERPAVRFVVIVKRGAVEALSASSITIKPDSGDAVTCSVDAKLARRLGRAGVAVGSEVEARCVRTTGDYRLVSFRKR